jgi:putative intracellular protease/amidase
VLNPERLRLDDDAMKIATSFPSAGKVVAAVCH